MYYTNFNFKCTNLFCSSFRYRRCRKRCRYDLPEDAVVNITIYDMLGRVVSNLVSSQQNAGYKSIQWNATNNEGKSVSAGLYLYQIQAGQFRQTKKMVLLK